MIVETVKGNADLVIQVHNHLYVKVGEMLTEACPQVSVSKQGTHSLVVLGASLVTQPQLSRLKLLQKA